MAIHGRIHPPAVTSCLSRGVQGMRYEDGEQARRVAAGWWRPAWRRRLLRSVRPRRYAVLAVGVLGAAIAAAVLVGLAWGRPHVTWHFRTTDNRLMLSLAVGHGPFASWLLSRSSVAASGHRGHRVLL